MHLSCVLFATLQLSSLYHVLGAKAPLADLHATIEKTRLQLGIPGLSVAVLYKGEIIFAEGFGKRNAQGDEYKASTLQPIGSVTKSFTAAAIGEMVAEGKLDWDTTPVNKYLPEFQYKDPVLTSQLTFVDLLSHRTDLGRKADLAFYRSTESRIELLKRIRYIDMQSKLKSTMNYSNAQYAAAGEAAARVAGMSYEDVVREKVIKPLGLNNTGFMPVEMRNRTSNYAIPFSALSLEDAQKGNVRPRELEEMLHAPGAPSGAIYSNVFDMVKYGRAIMKEGELNGKQVLNKSSVQELLTAHSIVGGPATAPESTSALTYGLGWMLHTYKGRQVYWHNGATGGFTANLAMFPDDDLVVAHLCNLMYSDPGSNIFQHVADELLDLPKTYNWLPDMALKAAEGSYQAVASSRNGTGVVPERIPNQPPTHPLQAYVGVYSHLVYGDASVTLEKSQDGKETLVIELIRFRSTLEPYHFDVFTAQLEDVTTNTKTIASFKTVTDNRVDSVVVDVTFPVEFKRKE
ncbi:hypothetical protein BGZ67_006201 [Mortierella alpina]|nr:hypothetical protein BGZ67_006201 [Mortierella alpina]